MNASISFLAGRAALYLTAGWAAVTLNFVVPRLMPGDPSTAMLARFQGEVEPETLEALRATFGLTDDPVPLQYVQYLGSVLTGDLGTSITYFPASVGSVIATGLLWSILLAGTALTLAFTLGTAVGAAAAWWRGGWIDRAGVPILTFLGAFPYFWLAMAALSWLGFRWGWFPLRHAWGSDVSPGWTLAFVSSALHHAVLPAGTMVIASVGGWVLGMRNVMIGVLSEGYVRYALARGLSPRTVWLRYAARTALLPNLTGFAMALGFVTSGALLTEIVFSYPGQGYLLLQAVQGQDYPLMQGLFLTITLAVLTANAMVDAATVVLDPRVR